MVGGAGGDEVSMSFNPRPAPKSGAIFVQHLLRRSGVFQSAPRSEERGDANYFNELVQEVSFNPRPAPKSGAIGETEPALRDRTVSIRAPLRRAGRYCST